MHSFHYHGKYGFFKCVRKSGTLRNSSGQEVEKHNWRTALENMGNACEVAYVQTRGGAIGRASGGNNGSVQKKRVSLGGTQKSYVKKRRCASKTNHQNAKVSGSKTHGGG